MAEVAPFHVMELLARARELEAQGRTIVHMEIGEPDFQTAKPICDAGIRAIENGHLFYTPALGIPELRAAISRFYRERYGVEVPASRIIITSGASGALLLAIGVLIDPGDEVLMADPGNGRLAIESHRHADAGGLAARDCADHSRARRRIDRR